MDVETNSSVRSFLNRIRIAVSIVYLIILAILIYFWYLYGLVDGFQIFGVVCMCLTIFMKVILLLRNLYQFNIHIKILYGLFHVLISIIGFMNMIFGAVSISLSTYHHQQMEWLFIFTFVLDVLFWSCYRRYHYYREGIIYNNEPISVEVIKI